MTRTQPSVAPSTGEVTPPSFERLQALTRELLTAMGDERSRRVAALNAAVRALPAQAPAEEVARHLIEALDQKTWEGLQDDQGWTCRAVAAQTLIDLGYPWALWVSPEDLEHLRRNPLQTERRPTTLARLKSMLPLFGLGALGVAGELLIHPHLPLEVPVIAGAVSASTASLSLLSGTRFRTVALGLTTAFGGLLLAAQFATGAGLALGLATLGAAAVSALTASTVRRLD